MSGNRRLVLGETVSQYVFVSDGDVLYIESFCHYRTVQIVCETECPFVSFDFWPWMANGELQVPNSSPLASTS